MELPYERSAMKNYPVPCGLCLTDQKVYIALRGIYQQYHEKQISREQAAADKKELLKLYESEKHVDDLYQKTVNLWKRIEIPAREYTFHPTIENADKFFASVYDLKPNWRSDRFAALPEKQNAGG